MIEIPGFQWIRIRDKKWVGCLFCGLKKGLFSYIQAKGDIQIPDSPPQGEKKWIIPLNVSLCLQRNSQIKSQTFYVNEGAKADMNLIPIFQSILCEIK